MRYTLAAAIVFTSAVSSWAQPADNAFASYRAFPCRSFIALPNGKQQLETADAIYQYAKAYDGFDSYPSYCNTVEQVRAECRLDARFTIGDAVDRLFAKRRNGIPLPLKRACGA